MDEAAAMGVHQVHFSGGEPTVRRDLEDLVSHASKVGLYTNLITSGVLLDRARLDGLVLRGLEHVQLSFQDSRGENADRIAGFRGGHTKKLEVARMVRATGLPLTVNAVVHRQNIDHLEEIIAMAVELDAARLEVAQVQYYGWALKNRAAFIPTYEQLKWATGIVESARIRLKGILAIDYVVPDYYAREPKICMGGWGRRFMNVNPAGRALPCHAAESIPGMEFDSVREHSLAWIWENSESFRRYRGTDWMPEPCQSCERKEIDWGGCRCQAFALAGNASATDPACARSPLHADIFGMAAREAAAPPPEFVYRRIGGIAAEKTPEPAASGD
jgi:pyrroloquinoline quinone biosynthesis protein E